MLDTTVENNGGGKRESLASYLC